MPPPQISLIHPRGNPNSRQAALALSEVGLLREIITTVVYNPQEPRAKLFDLLPNNIRKNLITELERRAWIAPNGVIIRSHPIQEVIRVILTRTNGARYLGYTASELVNWIDTGLDSHAAKHHLDGLDAVYSYEDAAATTFESAKQKGITCLYDLPIPFYRTVRQIQLEEAELFPELASALKAIRESVAKIERKEREILLADHVFVASSVTKKSLLDVGKNSEQISIIPYGAPIDYFQPQSKGDGIFRALYVGNLAPHKGVQYLLQAWQQLQLPQSELLLIGNNQFPEKYLAERRDFFRYMPCVPHHLLNQYYSAASVLVFPSLIEGFGLVILEAMACGIPVISTINTGGADVIKDGVDGFIVPIRDVESLKEKLEWCYCHPQELAEMGKLARQKAQQLTWKQYRHKLASKIQELWR